MAILAVGHTIGKDPKTQRTIHPAFRQFLPRLIVTSTSGAMMACLICRVFQFPILPSEVRGLLVMWLTLWWAVKVRSPLAWASMKELPYDGGNSLTVVEVTPGQLVRIGTPCHNQE